MDQRALKTSKNKNDSMELVLKGEIHEHKKLKKKRVQECNLRC